MPNIPGFSLRKQRTAVRLRIANRCQLEPVAMDFSSQCAADLCPGSAADHDNLAWKMQTVKNAGPLLTSFPKS
jgi:hypothetical protein